MSTHDFSNFIKKFPLYYSLKNKCISISTPLDQNQFKNAIAIIFKQQTSTHILSLLCMHHHLTTGTPVIITNFDNYDDNLKRIVIEYSQTLI
jgi:hypothetical protein